MKSPWGLLGASALPRPPEPRFVQQTSLFTTQVSATKHNEVTSEKLQIQVKNIMVQKTKRGSCDELSQHNMKSIGCSIKQVKMDASVPLWRVLVGLFLVMVLLTETCSSLPSSSYGSYGRDHRRQDCNLTSGDATARAGAAAQVLEAEVATSPEGSNKYTAALTVKRVLRRYRGPGRLKKQDVITLTLQRRQELPCVAVASLQVGKRYFVFLNAPARRNVAPKAVAAPIPYSRRARRLIRQEVCNKCGEYQVPSFPTHL